MSTLRAGDAVIEPVPDIGSVHLAARMSLSGIRCAYLARRAALGIRPEAVDYVLRTHLHADHAGWNTRLENGCWVPTFPNARYLLSRDAAAHWMWRATTNHGSYRDSVLPVIEAGRADLSFPRIFAARPLAASSATVPPTPAVFAS